MYSDVFIVQSCKCAWIMCVEVGVLVTVNRVTLNDTAFNHRQLITNHRQLVMQYIITQITTTCQYLLQVSDICDLSD